jgi:hypothetical protein
MWIDLAKSLLYPGIAIVALIIFFRAFKRTPNENIPVGVAIGESDMDLNNRISRAKNGERGVVTVEVLNQLIRENPDNMTQAIRGWMTRGKAAKN